MLPIFLKTLPFFLILGLGYFAARTKFFSEEASAAVTKFVFYFALPAMIFRFTATLPFEELFRPNAILAYLVATGLVYLIGFGVAMARGTGIEEAAFEGQCAGIGNVGFLGIPMLAMLMGVGAVASVMMVLAVDLVVFGSLIVIVIAIKRDGRVSLAVLGPVARALVTNPMVMAMAAGLIWVSIAPPLPETAVDFLSILGAAATPGALFAIGASLAAKSTERAEVAVWLSFAKLALHPAAVAIAALFLFPVEPSVAAVMIAAAAMPTAGNIYILAQHFRVAPHRVSTTILFSTVASIVTLTLVIAWVSG